MVLMRRFVEKMKELKVKIKLLEGGKLPEYKRDGDVCLDCYAREDVEVSFGERELIPLGFALELPEGYEAVVRPRSGLSFKGLEGAIGTIDTNYRGEVKAQRNILDFAAYVALFPQLIAGPIEIGRASCRERV